MGEFCGVNKMLTLQMILGLTFLLLFTYYLSMLFLVIGIAYTFYLLLKGKE